MKRDVGMACQKYTNNKVVVIICVPGLSLGGGAWFILQAQYTDNPQNICEGVFTKQVIPSRC